MLIDQNVKARTRGSSSSVACLKHSPSGFLLLESPQIDKDVKEVPKGVAKVEMQAVPEGVMLILLLKATLAA